MRKKFLVPVGTVVAALVASVSDTTLAQVAQNDSPNLLRAARVEHETDTVLKRLMYQIKEQTHVLVLRRSSSGIFYAGHGSHQSHHSHSSHRSGR